jgi:electron transfer DM13
MLSLPSCSVAAALIVAAILASAPVRLAAQQDSTMMSHDSAMAMPAETGMSHDSMMDHGKMMDHDTMGMGREGTMRFAGIDGQKAAGGYQLTETAGGKRQLTLGNDFSVTPAPELYLVLANGSTPDAKALWIGKLKQPAGTQTFDLPKGKDLAGYTTLLVYSKKGRQAVASAQWHATSGKMMDHM